MTQQPTHRSIPSRDEKYVLGRYQALALLLVCYLAAEMALRIALTASNLDEIASSGMKLLAAVGVGFLYDLLAGLWVVLPFSLFLLVMPDRWLRMRLWRAAVVAGFFAFLYSVLYLGVVEWFFFGEFNARFNTVAVDYLVFPHEVFVNLWDTYPVWQALIVVLAVTGFLWWWLRPGFSRSFQIPTARRLRLKTMSVYAVLLAAGTILLSPQAAHISDNRVVNEIAGNGLYSFAEAALTNELDYDSYYARLDDRIAFERLRTLLAQDGSTFLQSDDSLSIDRLVHAAGAPRRLNVVVMLEESFGSHFVKSLDPQGPGGTPEFEKVADSGLLFTNIYATGNRTVRGMEAVLASFPPIPGQSVVRRPGGRHIFTLPALLKSFGYQTAFIYGGLSYFDNMGSFASNNGFDRVIDRTDFAQSTFTTIWGVCDEDLFDNSLHILDTMQAAGKPFFTLLLTVSNHSPYTFPPGRIAADPKAHIRENAVQYADYALARFLRQAEGHSFFDSTVFVVLGDHGARVYGSQQIPMDSYRIPVLFYAPKILPMGERVGTLGSQLDVAPTIMAILNRSYRSEFFGRSLLTTPDSQTRALMSHNRDVALLRDNRMAVLGIRQETELWQRDSLTGAFGRLSPEQGQPLINDAIAYFQSAYHLYETHHLHPLPQDTLVPIHAGM